MKILILGDIVGEIGRKSLDLYLPKIKEKYNPNFIIANGENMGPRGRGITNSNFNFLLNHSIDVVTMGNHTFDNYQIHDIFKNNKNIIRPINLDGEETGKGTVVIEKFGKRIRVSNFIGTAFMFQMSRNPIKALEELLEKDDSDIHIIDFHAEATAEKMIFSSAADDLKKVTAVYGTHTHTQTADEQLLPNGTAFITDIGMNGSFRSSLGLSLNEIKQKYKTGLPQKFKEAMGDPQFNGILLDVNEKTNRVDKILRLNYNPQNKLK